MCSQNNPLEKPINLRQLFKMFCRNTSVSTHILLSHPSDLNVGLTWISLLCAPDHWELI